MNRLPQTTLDTICEQLVAAPSTQARAEIVRLHQLDFETVEQLGALVDQRIGDGKLGLLYGEAAELIGCVLSQEAKARGRWIYGNAYVHVGNELKRADEKYGCASDDYAALGMDDQIARLNVGRIGILPYLGRIADAMALAEPTARVLRRLADVNEKDRLRLASVLANWAIGFEMQGFYEESLLRLEEALSLLGSERDTRFGRIEHNRARTLTNLNQLIHAKRAFERAKAIFEKHAPDGPDLRRTQFNEGVLSIQMKRHAEAHRSLTAVIERLAAEPKRWLTALAYLNRAVNSLNCAQLELPESALQDSQHAIEILSGLPESPELTLAHVAAARIALRMGKLNQSSAALDRAEQIVIENGYRHITWQILLHRAAVAQCEQSRTAATDLLEQATREVERLRAVLQSDIFKAALGSDKLIVYERLVEQYFAQDEVALAIQTLERSRARILAERLIGRMQHLAASDKSDLMMQPLSAELQQLAQLESDRASVSRAITTDESAAKLADLNHEIFELEESIDKRIRALQRSKNRTHALQLGGIATLTDVLAHFDAKTQVVYYYELGDFVWGVWIDKQGVQARCKLAAKRVLQQAQHQLSSALSDPIDMGGTHGATMLELCLPKMQQRVDRLLSELATLLIVPFFEQANLQLGQHLLVIPCRYLHQIPFQALRVGDTYLLEQCAVSYAPSLTVLSHTLENRVAASRRMLFVGYDSGNLDQIRAEVDTLRSCFADAVFYENDAATAQRFLSDASQFNVLHLTCHAQFREDKPMLSGFAFADRYLTLGEIALLDLPCELATLGACVTGYGQQHGTDMFSLAAAFMGAGARSLIVSQWRIDDEAARRLVDTFYHSLLRGSSRVEALREAQLVLLQLGRQQPKQFKFFKHPAYWAALCLHGNWHAITL